MYATYKHIYNRSGAAIQWIKNPEKFQYPTVKNTANYTSSSCAKTNDIPLAKIIETAYCRKMQLNKQLREKHS